MKTIFNVLGSIQMAVPVYVGKDRVDVHTNIKKITAPDPETGEIPDDLYQYDETQFSRDEFMALLGETGAENSANTAEVMDAVCEHDISINDILDALCELDEKIGG